MPGRHAQGGAEELGTLDFAPEFSCELHSRHIGPCGPARVILSCPECDWSVAMSVACYRTFGRQEQMNHPLRYGLDHRLTLTDLRFL